MFCIIYCVIALLGVTQVQPICGEECQCGMPSDDVVAMRIVGGTKTAPHAYPWTVAIFRMDFLHCGGALVTDRHVLSAGHCFIGDIIQIMRVLAGMDNMNNLEGVVKRTLSDVIVHENFTSTETRDDNDIAIATLTSPVPFGQTIIPICLPKPFENFGAYTGTIVGWGRQAVNRPPSKDLLEAKLKILSDSDCMNSKLREHLTDNMICANAKGIDGCQGDSGGPLIIFDPSGRYVQAGITSWGIGCANPRYPGVYTKVSNYIDWIKEHIASGKTCK
ncbi:trypsin-1-like [Choristoneura fumiferana]|uniref:trypsin-1-like n=1 Tax=Choristoneura fumiferana TaxID=7141 RepID=UPI003D15C914